MGSNSYRTTWRYSPSLEPPGVPDTDQCQKLHRIRVVHDGVGPVPIGCVIAGLRRLVGTHLIIRADVIAVEHIEDRLDRRGIAGGFFQSHDVDRLSVTANNFIADALEDGIHAGVRRGIAVDIVFNVPIDDSQGIGEGVAADSQK